MAGLPANLYSRCRNGQALVADELGQIDSFTAGSQVHDVDVQDVHDIFLAAFGMKYPYYEWCNAGNKLQLLVQIRN
jgi:hypothetical protein